MPANMGLERVAHDQVHLHAEEIREVVLQGDGPQERGGLDEEHGRATGRSGSATLPRYSPERPRVVEQSGVPHIPGPKATATAVTAFPAPELGPRSVRAVSGKRAIEVVHDAVPSGRGCTPTGTLAAEPAALLALEELRQPGRAVQVDATGCFD